MKVLFLEIDTEREWAMVAAGPAYIGAYVRQYGHEVAMMHIPLDMTSEQAVIAIQQENPDILASSLTSRQWGRARSIYNGIRNLITIPVIVGGPHPTFVSEAVVAEPGIDYACLGEGEAPMLDVLTALEAGQPIEHGTIPNIRVSSSPTAPEIRDPFEPLDALPFMARDLLEEYDGVHHLATQRGCPFPCTYCAVPNYNRLYKGIGNFGRKRSHENILEELHTLQEAGALYYVIFLDDTFTIHPSWLKPLLERYRDEIGVPFSIHARADTVNPPLLELLASAGCRHITYGVESGSYHYRKEVLKRPMTNEQLIRAFHWSHDLGMLVTANYMLGMPGETKADLEQTLILHEALQPTDFGYFVFYPYPGTKLFYVCQQAGYLPPNYLELPATHRLSILNYPDLSAEDIATYYDRFTQLREQNYLQQFGTGLTASQQASLLEEFRQSAAIG